MRAFKGGRHWTDLIKADVVKCFDRIDHELLLSFLREQLAPRSDGIVKLIEVFLKTPIYDNKGLD